MAYAYVVSFRIKEEDYNALQIGAPLERAVQYMKGILPNQLGYLTSYGIKTVGETGGIHIIFVSFWSKWDDLLSHRRSGLLEQQLLREFEPHVKLEDLTADVYEEIE